VAAWCLLALSLALAGCAAAARSQDSAPSRERSALQSYLAQIEPLRLGVNRLLEGADPTLRAFAAHRITPRQAAQRMGTLEARFAAYAVNVAAIEPHGARLRSVNAPYAYTYVLEDSYLSALVAGLAAGSPDHLPDTQSQQRAAIIRWRIALTVLARSLGVALPADLQQAGRGEIAPAPGGS
jgi:hypothetical protein